MCWVSSSLICLGELLMRVVDVENIEDSQNFSSYISFATFGFSQIVIKQHVINCGNGSNRLAFLSRAEVFSFPVRLL